METTEEQEILPLPTEEALPQPEEPPVEQQQTKSVKNFWERLDEVFNLSKQTNQNLEDILEQFPDTQKINTGDYKSFVFQPERISISSNDDQTLLIARSNSLSTSGHVYAERFSSFRINFQKALRNVKSIQLLSAVVPNAVQNIPDESVCFFYYKIRTTGIAFQGEWSSFPIYIPGDLVGIGATGKNYACKVENSNIDPTLTYWQTTTLQAKNTWSATTAYVANDLVLYNNISYECITNNTNIIPGETYWVEINLDINPAIPNYYDLNGYHINVIYLFPTFGYPPESEPVANENGFNRTFQDYDDLVSALNFCAGNASPFYPANTNATIPNEVQFVYNSRLNKIQIVFDPSQINNGYYYIPCGYADPNIDEFMTSTSAYNFFGLNLPGVYAPQTTLNLRIGYTWNGVFPDPFASPNTNNDFNFVFNLLWYQRPKYPGLPAWSENIITCNSYPDLVNTSSVRIYADVTLGSTEDSSSQGGLLSVVPVNASNLGVSFYQNNFNNPLTKIPQNITEINIRMLTDTGLPYYLPNSATVLLELALEYK